MCVQPGVAYDSFDRVLPRLERIAERAQLVEALELGSAEAVELHRACVLDNSAAACEDLIAKSDVEGFATDRAVAIAHFTLAHTMERRGEFEAALSQYREAQSRDPSVGDVEARIRRLEARLPTAAPDNVPAEPAEAIAQRAKTDNVPALWRTVTSKIIGVTEVVDQSLSASKVVTGSIASDSASPSEPELREPFAVMLRSRNDRALLPRSLTEQSEQSLAAPGMMPSQAELPASPEHRPAAPPQVALAPALSEASRYVLTPMDIEPKSTPAPSTDARQSGGAPSAYFWLAAFAAMSLMAVHLGRRRFALPGAGPRLASRADASVRTFARPATVLQEPTLRAAPLEPVEPTQSVEPVKPVEPAKPVEPVKPVECVEPVEPASPSQYDQTEDRQIPAENAFLAAHQALVKAVCWYAVHRSGQAGPDARFLEEMQKATADLAELEQELINGNRSFDAGTAEAVEDTWAKRANAVWAILRDQLPDDLPEIAWGEDQWLSPGGELGDVLHVDLPILRRLANETGSHDGSTDGGFARLRRVVHANLDRLESELSSRQSAGGCPTHSDRSSELGGAEEHARVLRQLFDGKPSDQILETESKSQSPPAQAAPFVIAADAEDRVRKIAGRFAADLSVISQNETVVAVLDSGGRLGAGVRGILSSRLGNAWSGTIREIDISKERSRGLLSPFDVDFGDSEGPARERLLADVIDIQAVTLESIVRPEILRGNMRMLRHVLRLVNAVHGTGFERLLSILEPGASTRFAPVIAKLDNPSSQKFFSHQYDGFEFRRFAEKLHDSLRMLMRDPDLNRILAGQSSPTARRGIFPPGTVTLLDLSATGRDRQENLTLAALYLGRLQIQRLELAARGRKAVFAFYCDDLAGCLGHRPECDDVLFRGDARNEFRHTIGLASIDHLRHDSAARRDLIDATW